MHCAIFYENELAGNISLNLIDQSLKKAELGYWLRKDLQGKGIVSRSEKGLLNYAFNELDM